MQVTESSYLWGLPYMVSPLTTIPEETRDDFCHDDAEYELKRVPVITKEDVYQEAPEAGKNMVNY